VLSVGSSLGQYWELTKPRVVALIVFTAVIGMFLATPELPGWRALLLGSLGIWLAAASAAAINHLLDQRIDALMARTQHRPLPTGSLSSRQVLAFAVALGATSMLLLALFVNVLTAVLTFASLIGYAVIYTGYLKRATPQNIVIGGLAGAAPPLLGWAAERGWPEAQGFAAGFAALFDAPYDYHHALLLVLIIFVWTPPHFWALAIFRRDDYAKAMIPMLPVTHGVVYTRWQILFYTLLLIAATVLPYASGMSGLFYLGGALVLGGMFLYYAVRLFHPPDPMYPMRVFNYSIVYLMVLFAFLLVDHYLVAAPVAAEAAGGLSFERVG
jgi:protoheme IX farnesyltransferase